MRTLNYILFLLAGIFFSGCMVGPNYEKPRVTVEKNFAGSGGNMNSNPPPADWWKAFHDAELDKLIHDTVRSNYNLQIAMMRVREARFQRNITAADLFPNVDADAGYIHARGSKNVVLPLGGGGGASSGSSGSASGSGSGSAHTAKPQLQTRTQSASPSGGGANDSAFDNQLTPFGKGGLPGAETDLYQTGFDANWEIDVFGGARRRVEAANAQTQAAIEAERSLTITLLAEVARNYMELRGTQERLGLAKKNLSAQNEILELTRSRRLHGLASDLDVTQAAAEVAVTQATLSPLEGNLRRLIHALSILEAREPSALDAELETATPLTPAPPEIPIGLPSQLLERRPDVREAEQQIAAATANVGSAKADLFPKFALIASTGLDSTSIQNLFDWESRYFLISPTVTWRIFDAGRIMSNLRLQKANQQESILQYRNTILTALQEVEDALVAYATEQTRQMSLVEAVNQHQQSFSLARQQYDHGLTSFLNVLDAERSLLAAQDDLAQSHQTISTDLVALYKALGGGWQPAPSTTATKRK